MAQINKLKIPNSSSNNIIMTDENGIVTNSGISVDSVKNAVSVKQHYLDLTEITGTNITRDNEPIYTNIVNMITDYFNNDTLNIIIKTKTDTIIEEYTVSLKVNGNVIDLINNQPDITNDNKGTVSADFNRSILTITLNDDEEHSINTITINTNKTTIGVLDTNNTDTGDSVTYLPTTDSQPANKKYVDQQDLGLQTQITDLQDKAQDIVENISTEQAEYLTIQNRNSCPGQLTVIGRSTQYTTEGYNLLNLPEIYKVDHLSPIMDFALEPGQYTVKFTNATSNNSEVTSYVCVFLDSSDTPVSYTHIPASIKKQTFQLASATTKFRIWSADSEDQSQGVITTYTGLMVYAGSEDKPYEPYGVRPSPEFSSSIDNVTGDINIFDGELEQGSINYDSGLNEENENRTRSKNYIELPSNILKFKVIRTIVGNEFWIRFYDKDKKYLGYDSANGNYNKAQILQFNVLENTKYIRFVDLTNNLSNKIKITVDLLSYKYTEPNKGIIFIKNTCKNLINQDEIGNYNTYISYLSKTNEGYKTTSNFSNSRDCGTYLKLKKNTQYTVSLDIISITSEGIVRGEAEIMGHKPETDSNSFGTSLGVNSINSSHIGNRYKFTFNSGDYDFWTLHISGWYGSGISGILVYKDVQVEEGPEATEFKDGSQEFEFPLEEGQRLHEEDYLADDGIHNKRITIIFDGTESSWAVNTNATNEGYSHFRYNNYPNLNVESSSTALLCSHFKRNPVSAGNYINDTSGSNILYIGIDNNIIGVTDSDDNSTKLTKWKNWLANQYENGTPVTIETRLREEEIEPYTTEQQPIANQLNTLKLYEGQNYIYTTNAYAPLLQLNSSVQGYIDAKFNIVDQQIGAIESKVDTILG